MKFNEFFPYATPKKLLAYFMLSLAVLLIPLLSQAETQQRATVTWHIETEKLKKLREELKLKPAQIIPDPKSVAEDRGLPAVYIVTAVLLLPDLAKALVDVYKDIRYGQVIINQDAAGKINIWNVPEASNDTLVFIDAKGNIVFKDNIRTIDAKSLLEKLISVIAGH